jgi:hypothetical protein
MGHSCYQVCSDRVAILIVSNRTDLFGRGEGTERILVEYSHGRYGAGNKKSLLARASSNLTDRPLTS